MFYLLMSFKFSLNCTSDIPVPGSITTLKWLPVCWEKRSFFPQKTAGVGETKPSPQEAPICRRRQITYKCSKAGSRDTEGGSRTPGPNWPRRERPLLPDWAPRIRIRTAGVNSAGGPGLQHRRGRPDEPSACGALLTAATLVGGVGGLSYRRRLRARGGRGEPGVPRTRRSGQIPPHGGQGAEAAASQKHVKQQKLEEQ